MATQIKSIHLKKEKDETIIGFVDSYQPRDSTKVGNDNNVKSSDLPRHADFEHAMQRMKYHLVIGCELAKPQDGNGNYLSTVHFNDYLLDEDGEPDVFQGLELTAMIIQGKNANDGVQLLGTKTLSSGEVVKLKTPSIALVAQLEGYNYPMREILSVQVEKALFEAEQYNERKKHGAGVQMAANFQEKPVEVNNTGDAIDKVIGERKAGKSSGMKKQTIKQAAASPLPEKKAQMSFAN